MDYARCTKGNCRHEGFFQQVGYISIDTGGWHQTMSLVCNRCGDSRDKTSVYHFWQNDGIQITQERFH